MCESKSAGTNAVSFAMGTALGAGLGVFLSTKKGRRLIKKAWKEVEPYFDEAVENAQDGFEDAKEAAKVKVQEVKTRTTEKVRESINDIEDLAVEKLPPVIKKPVKRAFFKGV